MSESEPPSSTYPTEFQRKVLWRALTGLAILVLGVLIVGLIWLGSNILSYLQPVLIPLAMAGIAAYLLDPLVRRLQRYGLGHVKSIIVVFLVILISLGALCFVVAHPLSEQLKELFAKKDDVEGVTGSKVTAEQLDEAKSNKLYGWIVSQAMQKDSEAVQAYVDAGGELVRTNGATWTADKAGANLPDDLQKPWSSEVALQNFRFTQVGGWIESAKDRSLSWMMTSGGQFLGGKLMGFLGVIIGFALVPIYLYYFLKERNSIQSSWQDYIPLKSSEFKDEVVSTLSEINGYLISFFRGQVVVAFIDGFLVGIALTIFQLPYGLLIGIFMALLGIIPYIGNILCLIPACIIAFMHGANEPFGLPQWGYVVGVVAIFFVVQQINSIVTAPKIVGDSVGLHPMTVIFSMLFWSLILGGFLGALLAVPLTAAVKVLFRRYIWEKGRSPIHRWKV